MNIVTFVFIPVTSLLILGYSVNCDKNELSVATSPFSNQTIIATTKTVDKPSTVEKVFTEGGQVSKSTATSEDTRVHNKGRSENKKQTVSLPLVTDAVNITTSGKQVTENIIHSVKNNTTIPLNIVKNITGPTVTKNENVSNNSISKSTTTIVEAVHKPAVTISEGDESEFSLHKIGTPENVIPKSNKSEQHPNLIVPIVITVFTLPLFAVLGYYALKHGREAWKNRHYRRMDFLLDGMYND